VAPIEFGHAVASPGMPSRRGPSRGLWIGIAVVVVVLIGVVVLLSLGDDDSDAKPKPTKDTRPIATGIGITSTGNPRSGTYRYRTTGQESINTPPTTNKYPATTTVTVVDTDCGYDSTWNIAQGRSETTRKCIKIDPDRHRGWTITATESANALLQPNPSVYACVDLFDLYTKARVGETYAGQCTQGTQFSTISYETVDTPKLVVGKVRVPTVHLLIRTVKGGRQTGQTTEDRWVLPGSGLVVRSVVRQTDQVSTAAGPAKYQQRYRVDLSELAPTA
jgi:hypothetical protein